MKKTIFFAMALTMASESALALDAPEPGTADIRVQFVTYNPSDVVKIVSHFGYVVDIVLQPGESVLERGVYLGDPDAWTVGTLNNHFFIKPKAEGGQTNMTLLTNRRAYNFLLSSHWPKKGPAPKDMQFQVNFDYPQDTALAATQAAQLYARQQGEAAMKAALQSRPAPKNWNYSVQGNETTTPDAAWDDGTFTYFRFKGNREMPAIFVVNEDGSESLVNHNVEDDTIVVQTLGRQFVFRKGKQVSCIFNEAFDSLGFSNTTGTTSPDVIREIKGSTQ